MAIKTLFLERMKALMIKLLILITASMLAFLVMDFISVFYAQQNLTFSLRDAFRDPI